MMYGVSSQSSAIATIPFKPKACHLLCFQILSDRLFANYSLMVILIEIEVSETKLDINRDFEFILFT